MRPVHPGEILREELEELGLSANALSKALGVPVNRVTMILNGQRGVSADTALRLARYFGTTPQLWLNLQKTWELRRAEIEAGRQIAEQVTDGRGGPRDLGAFTRECFESLGGVELELPARGPRRDGVTCRGETSGRD